MKHSPLKDTHLIFTPEPQHMISVWEILTCFNLFLKTRKNVINIFQVQNYVKMKNIFRF